MSSNEPPKEERDHAGELRRRAEDKLARHPRAAPVSDVDARRALHELQVHQLELEMQNEALIEAEAQAQDALRKLAELNASIEQRIVQRTAELAAAREAAEAAHEARSRFLFNMSHELRTPMTGLIGMVDLSIGRAADAKQADWLGKARTSGRHLLAIIDDILDLSSMDAGQLRMERAELTLGPVLDLVTGVLAAEVARRGLSFQVEIDAALAKRPLLGDKRRLAQVLLNLVGNAVKFTDRGSVTLSARIEPTTAAQTLQVRFDVCDTGIGIAQDDQRRIFRAFQQVDDSMSRRHGGTGLGLAISADMVRLMHGKIGLDSEPGSGSTFWFSVPFLTASTP